MGWFIVILLAVIVLWVIGAFNGLVVLRNRANEAESDIDVQLKRRHDLIPNLVNTVQGYATHERELLENITRARSAAMGAADKTMSEKAQAENMLTSTLKSLFAVVENYPELKANQNFLALQEELSDTENKIMSARRFYNTNIRDYNTRREVFPTSLIANWFNFKKRDMFELDDISEKEVPEVSFDSKPTPPKTPPHDDTPKPPTPPVPTERSEGPRSAGPRGTEGPTEGPPTSPPPPPSEEPRDTEGQQ